MALNCITNVHCRWEAVGESPGMTHIPPIDYNEENNFGGLSLGATAGEAVRVVTLDSLNLSRCQFLKVDVEGMELSVLKGASQTIQKFRPVLYVENDKPERSPALIEFLFSLGYTLYWHVPPLYDPANFYRNAINEFERTVSINVLGLHSSVTTDISGLKRIESPQSDWRK
jgi:hypothetical protein